MGRDDSYQVEVIVGYPFDKLFVDVDPALQRQGKFVIAGFDEFSSRDCQYSKAMQAEFYRKLTEMAREEDQVTVIFKPKRDSEAGILSMIGWNPESPKENSCVILPPSELPFKASLEADLVVGLGVNSACLEAVLAGRPAIYWVPTGFKCRQLDSVDPRLTYSDLDLMIDDIRAFKQGDPEMEQLGSHDAIIDEIDPWRDGKGGERVGGYLRTYLEAMDEGLDRDVAISRANRAYQALWGDDKVRVAG